MFFILSVLLIKSITLTFFIHDIYQKSTNSKRSTWHHTKQMIKKKSLLALEAMFNKNQLTGEETPSQLRNSFPHFFEGSLSDKNMWVRRYNSVTKNVKKDLAVSFLLSEQKETIKTIRTVTLVIDTCNVSLDFAASYWDDPKSPHAFVSVIMFLPFAVFSDSVNLNVKLNRSVLRYYYDRPLPARDSNRLCRRWLTTS